MGTEVIDCGVVRAKAIAPGIERIDGFFPASFLAIQTTREGGASVGAYASFNLATHVGDDSAAVAANRERLASHLSAAPRWLNQVHGTVIAQCAASNEPPKADAAIAVGLESAAVVMTADCLPLLVARPATNQCAAIHAGWKGMASGVIEATFDRMASVSAPANVVGPDDWYVWLGPAIGPKAFEVGQDVVDAFVRNDAQSMAAFLRREAAGSNTSDLKDKNHPDLAAPHKWLADLPWLAVRKIELWTATCGTAARVFVARSNECSYSDTERYFSFRRDKVCGRMASLICRLY